MHMNKRFIPIANVTLSGKEEEYVMDAVRSSWISSKGKFIGEFEKSVGSYLGTKHAVSVSNGTCALMLALKAIGVGPGDEVIVPTLTFAATINAVIHVGADPVLVDSERNHWNMDPAQFKLAITPKTKAVIPVHLYGHPCNLADILGIAEDNNVVVIEDAAEAQGAEWHGKKVGGIGTIGCMSFFANKIITTGEGGMCVTNDDGLAQRMKILRDHGMSPEKRYWHEEIGYNFRMTNINAAIGVAQMENIDEYLKRRNYLSNIYADGLSSVAGLDIYPDSPYGNKVDWLFCVFLNEKTRIERDSLIAKLKGQAIDSRPTFYPIHLMPPYRDVRKCGSLDNAVKFGLSGINLPLYPSLNEDEVNHIMRTLELVLSA